MTRLEKSNAGQEPSTHRKTRRQAKQLSGGLWRLFFRLLMYVSILGSFYFEFSPAAEHVRHIDLYKDLVQLIMALSILVYYAIVCLR